jgi:hypothetical protein
MGAAMKRGRPDPEVLRRLRLGDLKTLLRSRYGHTLPDDDAGREDLHDLLLPVSCGPDAKARMLNIVETWAPWMEYAELAELINAINNTPIKQRRLSGRQLGQRQNITNAQREQLKLWTISPSDMTDEQLKQHRRAKETARIWQYRRGKGAKPREQSLTRTKPWLHESQPISRAQWYRRKQVKSKKGNGAHPNRRRSIPQLTVRQIRNG